MAEPAVAAPAQSVGRIIARDVTFDAYTTPLLPGLVLSVPGLRQTPPPDIFAVVRAVEAMNIE